MSLRLVLIGSVLGALRVAAGAYSAVKQYPEPLIASSRSSFGCCRFRPLCSASFSRTLASA